MPDWRKSMQQTFEYYVVDPGTWRDISKLDTIISCTITWDSETDTLGSATIDSTETLGECYVRVYLVTVQNGVTERFPLGTFLVQTPSTSFDGKITTVSMDAYTPLLELKENPPHLGYSILKEEKDSDGKTVETNVMERAYQIVRDNVRAPVVGASSEKTLDYDFVSDTDDTWLTYTRDLISTAKFKFALDEMGRILFSPKQDTASLQPVTTFDDSNSSILYPDVTLDRDLYGIPNVVEVTYSNNSAFYHARVVNNDPNSPISTVNRGREIIYRETNPSNLGNPTDDMIQEYAHQLLRDLSAVEIKVKYTHGYYPVRIDDCVRLDYKKAGLNNVKARVINQSIKCVPGCSVKETSVYTNRLWNIEKYYITYDANGGNDKSVPHRQTKWNGSDLRISDTIPTCDGKTFLGWAEFTHFVEDGENKVNTEVAYRPGDAYDRNSNITLYAVWG